MNFEDFLMEVEPKYQWFARLIDEYLTNNDCKLKMSTAKNGHVVSYQYGKKKYVLMNFVFRKKGLIARIYCSNVTQYIDVLESLPDSMKEVITNSPQCKRFEDPPKCAPTCIGYVFDFLGVHLQSCRYSCFLFEVTDETIPFIETLIKKELDCRN